MSITKPFTFVAGTKARANEVNADFDTLYTQVNSNISAINTNANDIDNLESNKANINGSTSQVFKVADPVVAMDAVNKQTMMGAMGNTINYIDGYVINKDSGSPNDTILVSAGSCYDYTKSVVLTKDTSTTKQNTSQGASTTYYVYVIGNDSGSSVDILISSSAVTPALPEGYTKFRQIGNYTTDSSSHIETINNLSNSTNANTIVNSIAPDYTHAISISLPYTVKQIGWVTVCMAGAWGYFRTYVNGKVIGYNGGSNDNRYWNGSCNTFMVSPNDYITTEGNVDEAYFAPMKGGI